ncbi:hypothetical protein ACQP3C_29060, partial [Escherichia coli]
INLCISCLTFFVKLCSSFCYVFILAEQGLDPGASSCMLSKGCTTELQPHPQKMIFRGGALYLSG